MMRLSFPIFALNAAAALFSARPLRSHVASTIQVDQVVAMDLAASNAFTVVGPATLTPNAVVTGQVTSANAQMGHGSATGIAVASSSGGRSVFENGFYSFFPHAPKQTEQTSN